MLEACGRTEDNDNRPASDNVNPPADDEETIHTDNNINTTNSLNNNESKTTSW